jgi:hypothetical protein
MKRGEIKKAPTKSKSLKGGISFKLGLFSKNLILLSVA